MAPLNAIANLIPMTQAAALAGHNVGKLKKKELKTKDILGLGVTNVVGASLIQSTAQITGGL